MNTGEASEKAKVFDQKNGNHEKKSGFAFWKVGLVGQVKTDDLSPDDIIIAVVGPTGSGKSTFINTITGVETAVGHSLEPCTIQVRKFRRSLPQLAYGDLVFVDTPGFNSPTHTLSDADILKMVANWLKSTYLKDIKLSGLLYLHRITDNRVASPTPLRHLPMINELCGKNSFQNVILATTMWDEIDEETGAARELELKSKHWRPMLDRNSTTSRFNGTRGSAFTLIDPLVNTANKRNLDLLEKEMQDMRKKLPETSAGQELFSTMEKLVRQREDLLSQIRNELKRADCDQIRLNLESLQEEHLKLQINLESTIKEMRRLKLSLSRLVNMTDSFSKFSFRVLKSVVSKFIS